MRSEPRAATRARKAHTRLHAIGRTRLRRAFLDARLVSPRSPGYVLAEAMASGSDVADTEDFFEMSLDHLCVAGFDGYFKRVNRSWQRTLGYSTEELLSMPSLELVHPDDRAATLAGRRRLQTGETMGPLVNRYRCKDGSYRWFEWRSIAHADRGLVYAAARDVTEEKLADERLAQSRAREDVLQRQLTFADRMASVGTLAGGVAHAVNSPLGSIAANASLILEDLQRGVMTSASELLDMATDIKDAAERIQRVVAALKTFSRAEKECPSFVDVRAMLDAVVDLTSTELRHRARVSKHYGDTPLVLADDTRLGQVFVHLLMNAAQALPEGSSEEHEVAITTRTDDEGRAVIEVRDTGSGITAETMKRIFDPFFTTKAVGVGTGLGLSICHTIVTGMNGAIDVVSEPNVGTTFRITLPGVPAELTEEPTRPAPPSETDDDARTSAAVLVVDDDPAIGAVIRRVLGNHDVTAVTTAKSAIALLESGRQFDVILSDLMMPEMTGMDFYAELERRFPRAARRVVFLSGGAFTPGANAFLDRVTNPRLDKPFAPQRLRALVGRARSRCALEDR